MGMAGIPVVQAPASSALVPPPAPLEAPAEAARPQRRQEGPSDGAGGASGVSADYRWPDPVTLPPSIAPKQRRSYPSQAAQPAPSPASPLVPSTSLSQGAPGAAEGASQDGVTQRRPQSVQAPETASGADVLSAEEAVSSGPARGDHGDISDLFSNAAAPVGRRRRRRRKDLRVPARAPEPVQTEEKTTTGPVVRHQEHVAPPRSRSKSLRQPKEPPAAFLPIAKDPRSLRQRLHGTGAPLVPDARTHRLAVLPQSLSLAPLEDLAMRPLTPQEKAAISETFGDEFQLHVPRIPAVHYQEPDKTRPLLVWLGRWCGRGWWSVISRLFVLIGGLVFVRSRGSVARRGLVTITRSGTGVLMMLGCLGWGLRLMGRGRGLLGGCVW